MEYVFSRAPLYHGAYSFLRKEYAPPVGWSWRGWRRALRRGKVIHGGGGSCVVVHLASHRGQVRAVCEDTSRVHRGFGR